MTEPHSLTMLTPGSTPRTADDLDVMTMPADALALRGAYLHVPFCFHKCHYCDFYSIVDNRDRQDAFVDRMTIELDAAADRFTRPLESIFVGGGTPTLLPPERWRRLFEAIHRALPRDDRTEFSIEANPETVTDDLARTLAAGGVNRASIGAQSFDPRHLKTLERWHDPDNVGRSVRILRDAGITNVNIDLIFAIPGQTLAEWQFELDAALALDPTHLSCYGLTYEPNTAMTARLRAGRFEPASEDLEAAMYEMTLDRLADAGFEQYEISNWARPGRTCRHNLLYWRNEHWWPFGPAAAGHVAGRRWRNVPRLGDYLDVGPLPPITDVEHLDRRGRVGEQLMLGFRLREGIAESSLHEWLADAPDRRATVDGALRDGLLERHDGAVRFTRRGMLVADSVLSDLV
ncbi:MAG: radical SAM family heme chaperone HemW [Phycisphaerales bacterium]|nr:radical SAM family heme chaperone HemW [Phycisphaerales bacterium]